MVRGDFVTNDGRGLRGAVAFGPERTIEQDSTFAFRVIVDIAIKALSKAINDPTTAVLAIDQLQRLLRVVGPRHLHDQQIADDKGQLRVLFRTPNWDDFVQLSFREIRLYGAENFQIARRLRAMIDLDSGLTRTTPPGLGARTRCFSIEPSTSAMPSPKTGSSPGLRTCKGSEGPRRHDFGFSEPQLPACALPEGSAALRAPPSTWR